VQQQRPKSPNNISKDTHIAETMSELNRILHIIDDAPKRFADNLPKIERKIYGEISVLLKGLQIDTKGHIVSSVENLNLIGRIRKKLEKIIVSKEYASLVKSFIADFAEVAKMPAAIATLDNDTKNKISALSKVAIDRTVEGLIGQGFKQDVVGKLYDTLLTNVTVGGSYANMVETLRRSFVSDSEGQGQIAKKAKQYVNDTISQFAGQNNKIVADMLGSEWFAYEGSNLTTTREFCEHLVKKRWVHKSEIPTILKGKIDGYQCEIYEKTGLPHGMIAGTDEDNFIIYCGGYNCGHKLIPVNEAAVPKSVRDKVNRLRKMADRYKDITFESVPIKGKGILELPTKGRQNKQEYAKNKEALTILANSNGQYRLLPIIEDGNKNPDAFNLLTQQYADIKIATSTNGKNIIQGSLKTASKQGVSEVIIRFTKKLNSNREAYEALKATFKQGRSMNIETVIFILPNKKILKVNTERFK